MHIGFVWSIGMAATDHYYRRLIEAAAAAGFDLELTIIHADSPNAAPQLGSQLQSGPGRDLCQADRAPDDGWRQYPMDGWEGERAGTAST